MDIDPPRGTGLQTERPAAPVWAELGLAGGLAFLAGATDAFGLTMLHDRYVSFMSGNTTMLGVSAGSGDGARAGQIALLIGLFVAGAATGAVVSDAAGRLHMPSVVLVASAALCLPVYAPGWAVALVFAMGALNAALDKVGGETIGLTYVTGALVKFGGGFGRWLTGTRPGLSWIVHAATWASVLLGACLATFAMRHGLERPWPLPCFGVLMAALSLATIRFRSASATAGEAAA